VHPQKIKSIFLLYFDHFEEKIINKYKNAVGTDVLYEYCVGSVYLGI